MQPETTYPKETSSNSGDKSGLTNPDDEPWTPDEDDKEPTVTITIDDEEDKFIESVTVTGTENVGSVTVTVVDEDGNEVCFCYQHDNLITIIKFIYNGAWIQSHLVDSLGHNYHC